MSDSKIPTNSGQLSEYFVEGSQSVGGRLDKIDVREVKTALSGLF